MENVRKYKNSFFRFKKFPSGDYLITNDVGKFSFLSHKDFGSFISGNLEEGSKYTELVSKNFIIDDKEQYVGKVSREYTNKNYFLGLGPTLHIVVTTLRCNHKCKYCHASVSSEGLHQFDMDEKTAKKVVDTMFYTNSTGFTIEFQGGESLLNWDIIKYITEYAEFKSQHLGKKVSFALVTNLTCMDDEKLEYLIKHNISISTSLDGNEYIHNKNRVYSQGNSFQEVTSWITKINKLYKERGIQDLVGALLTTTRDTLPRHKEIVDTYVELGLEGIFLRPLNPYGFAAKILDEIGYSTEEFLEFYINTMEYILEVNKKGKLFRENYSCIFLGKILSERDPNFLDKRSPCGACIGQVAYDYDGKVYSCDEGRMFGRVGDDSFLMTGVQEKGEDTYVKMMNSDTTKIMVQASTLDGLPGYNDHVYKPYLGVCPIYSYKSSGSIFSNFSKDERTKLDIGILDYLFTKIQEPENRKVFQKWLSMSDELIRLQC